MKTPLAILAVMVSTALAAGTAHACGYCDGDRIASVYDAAIVAEAQRVGNGVVIVGIEGPFGGSVRERAAIVKAIESVRGVVKGSVVLSHTPSAARLTFRPSKGSAETLVSKASAVVKKRIGCTLIVLRVECEAVKR